MVRVLGDVVTFYRVPVSRELAQAVKDGNPSAVKTETLVARYSGVQLPPGSLPIAAVAGSKLSVPEQRAVVFEMLDTIRQLMLGAIEEQVRVLTAMELGDD